MEGNSRDVRGRLWWSEHHSYGVPNNSQKCMEMEAYVFNVNTSGVAYPDSRLTMQPQAPHSRLMDVPAE